jgi:spore coat protein CotH
MLRFIVGLGLGVLLIHFIALPESAGAKDKKSQEVRDAFFKDGKIPHLKIEVGQKEADSLRREPRKYVKGKLKDGDKEFTDVAIHLRGAVGSFRAFDDKPGLTINMDKFKDDQKWNGLDKFHLANSVQDPSYLSELICGQLFEASGVPCARISHAIVTLNGKARGFYYLKEGYDSDFLERHFKNHHGNLYDGGFLKDIDQPLDLLSTKGDVKDRADLKALVAACNEADKTKRFAKMEKVLDVEKFISYLVMDSIIWDWDGYPMNRNNYRIYHDPERDKIVFIPSGLDQMFTDVNAPVLPNFQGLVARQLLDTPEGRKRYIDRATELMQKVFKPDDLIKRLDELEKRVQPVLAMTDAGAGRDYKNQVNRIREVIRQRPKVIEAQLKQLKK